MHVHMCEQVAWQQERNRLSLVAEQRPRLCDPPPPPQSSGDTRAVLWEWGSFKVRVGREETGTEISNLKVENKTPSLRMEQGQGVSVPLHPDCWSPSPALARPSPPLLRQACSLSHSSGCDSEDQLLWGGLAGRRHFHGVCVYDTSTGKNRCSIKTG